MHNYAYLCIVCFIQYSNSDISWYVFPYDRNFSYYQFIDKGGATYHFYLAGTSDITFAKLKKSCNFSSPCQLEFYWTILVKYSLELSSLSNTLFVYYLTAISKSNNRQLQYQLWVITFNHYDSCWIIGVILYLLYIVAIEYLSAIQ